MFVTRLLNLFVLISLSLCGLFCMAQQEEGFALHVANKKSNVSRQQTTTETLSLLVTTTQQTIEETWGRYKNHIEILPSPSDYYFDSSSFYDYIAMPLFGLPAHRIHVELIGQVYDPIQYQLTNRSQDDVLQDYQPNGELNWSDAKVALGLGASMAIAHNIRLQSMYTTGTLPGFGASNVAMTMQFKF